MEQAIAAEWGRFLRELEARSNGGVRNDGDGMAPGNIEPGPDVPNAAVSQQPSGVTAQASVPADFLNYKPSVPLVEKPDSVQPQDAAPSDRSHLEQLGQPPAEGGLASRPQTTPAGASSARDLNRSSKGEIAKYTTRSQWNGTAFEDCRVLVTPVPETIVTGAEPAKIQGDAVEQTASPTATEKPEGEMWKSVNSTDSPVTETPASNADSTRAAHGQDASRWFVLKGMMGGAAAPEKTPDHADSGHVPVLEVFSLAGGVGKTSLVATLGRALSARGERVLLVEATFLGSLQYYFGATDSRPGAVRTFRPPASSSDAPIQLATVDPDALLVESTVQGSLAADVQRWAQGASRVIVDVATGATAIARGLMRTSTVVLVPLIPDVHAVITATSINAFFQHNSGTPGGPSEVYYLLNQFDPSLPLHLDLREVLREKLGDRMLPFALPRTPAIGEALAEGMTIMDYAPDSPATEDFLNLAKWLDDVLAPADNNRRGIRWSER